MKCTLDQEAVLHICPENNIELNAIKYWIKEFKDHGAKMISVCDTVEEAKKVFLEHNPEGY